MDKTGYFVDKHGVLCIKVHASMDKKFHYAITGVDTVAELINAPLVFTVKKYRAFIIKR